jgi:hypothetical protein
LTAAVEPKTAKLVEMVLVFGGVLGFAVWQLVSVRRELRRDRQKQYAGDDAEAGRRDREGG